MPGTEREIAVLPAIAERLPVGVPAPVFVGRPGDDFPCPFYGARHLAGVEATGHPVDPVALGAALRALHAPETLAAVGEELPADPLGRVDLDVRLPRLEELGVDAPALVAAARELPPARHTAVCHGDLHMRQLLVDGDALTGIVDWVDVCRSDSGGRPLRRLDHARRRTSPGLLRCLRRGRRGDTRARADRGRLPLRDARRLGRERTGAARA